MPKALSILVITSCTSLKLAGEEGSRVPAEQLYVGEQHRRLMRGVAAFRSASTSYELDLRILSAGYGLISGTRQIQRYDASFAGLPTRVLGQRAEALGVPASVDQLLSQPYALALLLLGNDYMRAASLSPHTKLGGPTIAFGGAQLTHRLRGTPSLKIVSAGKAEASRFSCGLVGLKGELGGRLLQLLAGRPDLVSQVASPDLEILQLLDSPLQRSLEAA